MTSIGIDIGSSSSTVGDDFVRLECIINIPLVLCECSSICGFLNGRSLNAAGVAGENDNGQSQRSIRSVGLHGWMMLMLMLLVVMKLMLILDKMSRL